MELEKPIQYMVVSTGGFNEIVGIYPYESMAQEFIACDPAGNAADFFTIYRIDLTKAIIEEIPFGRDSY